jgi:iron complex transport system ATP-binding protein
MGVEAAVEKAFEPICDKTFKDAVSLMGKASMLVDSGFPVSQINSRNTELVFEAAKRDLKVCSIRSKNEINVLYGRLEGEVIQCNTPAGIIEKTG